MINMYLTNINCSYDSYLDFIRCTLKQPVVMFRMDMTQMYINTFGSWIASVLNSNMYLQIILDSYSYAAYVVEYVNKSKWQISHLNFKLIKIYVRNPDYDYTKLMTKVSLKMLNSIEMSATGPSGICVNLWVGRYIIRFSFRPRKTQGLLAQVDYGCRELVTCVSRACRVLCHYLEANASTVTGGPSNVSSFVT